MNASPVSSIQSPASFMYGRLASGEIHNSPYASAPLPEAGLTAAGGCLRHGANEHPGGDDQSDAQPFARPRDGIVCRPGRRLVSVRAAPAGLNRDIRLLLGRLRGIQPVRVDHISTLRPEAE